MIKTGYFDSIKAVIFDFDGVIVNSKLSEYESWRHIFDEHGYTLTMQEWINIINNIEGRFDPVHKLQSLTGMNVNVTFIRNKQSNIYEYLVRNLKPNRGIRPLIRSLHRRKIKLAIASSGLNDKLHYYLKKLKLLKYFSVIIGRDDVDDARKPLPDVYLKALQKLKIKPYRAVAIEDSPPGIRAAKLAGIYTIAVPNQITKYLDLSESDLLIKRINEINTKYFNNISMAT